MLNCLYFIKTFLSDGIDCSHALVSEDITDGISEKVSQRKMLSAELSMICSHRRGQY